MYSAVTFFVIMLIAALLGFTDIVPQAADVARAIFCMSLLLFVVFSILHALRKGP